MMQEKKQNPRRKGVAVIITAGCLMGMVPVVGLAIDASLLYVVKAKLSAAADAAALAAARSLNVGLTIGEQEDSARSRAEAFFAANFPEGYFNTHSNSVSVVVAETAYRTRTVTVSVATTTPLYFMRVLRYDTATVRAEGKASRRDVNLILVLDISSSMNSGSTPTPCAMMRTAARNFVSQFANGRDRLALITFSTSYKVAFSPSMNFKNSSPTLDSILAGITCTGNTGSAQAITKAYQILSTGIHDPDITVNGIDEPGALNLIVFFTDGRPNGILASFPVKTASDTRHGPRRKTDGTWSGNTTDLYSTLPSTCLDAEGDSYDRDAGSPVAQYVAPGWNPNWTPANKTGIITQWSGFADHGTTAGLFNYKSGGTGTISDRAGCLFSTNDRVRADVAYIPNQDIYGNRTDCCYYTAAETHITGRALTYADPIQLFDSGPYRGFIRPDHPFDLGKASANATDNAAQRAISDTRLDPVIYSIGLGDINPANRDGLDPVLLKRAANVQDPQNSRYDPNCQSGLYVYAPNSTELNAAFAQVASEILRLAR